MKEKEDMLSVINIKVREATNNLNVEIYKKTTVIQEDLNARGMYQSGMHISRIQDLMNNSMTQSCKTLLEQIDILQDEWNVRYQSKELTNISELVLERYQSIVDNSFTSHLKKVVEAANGEFSYSEMFLNNLRQNIGNIVHTKVKEMELKNKLMKDSPGLKQAKIANAIAIVALAVSIISFFISVLK